MTPRDLLGRELDDAERELLEVYRRLEAYAARTDLPPCAAANARLALAALAQAVNDLDLVHERLDALGV